MSDDELKNAREVLSAYDVLVDDLRDKNARLAQALNGLVDRLDETNASPEFKSVWTLHHVHGGRYAGPTWVDALERARAALASVMTEPTKPE